MKHFLYVITFFLTIPSAQATLGNPCGHITDCRNQRAEEIIYSVSYYADAIRELYLSIDEQKLTKVQAYEQLVKADAIADEAENVQRNFSNLLGIESSSERVAVSRRYSSYMWQAIMQVQEEIGHIRRKVKYMGSPLDRPM